MLPELILTPTDFVSITNQTLEVAFGLVKIVGELANFRVSKNRWVYFDIKDDLSKVSCFASVYNLPGPLKDGMLVQIVGQPRLHPQFGFSITVQQIKPSGEGTIKKAFELLKAKLQREGIFDESRKRTFPYPPQKIALITSVESAAYADFIKILNARWPYVDLAVYDAQVQGDNSPPQLIDAISLANSAPELADVLVITRGGGSSEDLAAFDDERVVRAITKSRIPTLVAIGHEINISLSELAADKRASTPSNAAELLTPDKNSELKNIHQIKTQFKNYLLGMTNREINQITDFKKALADSLEDIYKKANNDTANYRQLLKAFNPEQVLKRGYAIVRITGGQILKSVRSIKEKDLILVKINDGELDAEVKSIRVKL
jgi:exodeoxyribonuclease VII large subunit